MSQLKRFIPIVILFALYSATTDRFNVGAQENYYIAEESVKEPQPQGRGFSLIECIQHAAQNSFEVKLARLDFLIEQTGQASAEAVFDTTFSLNAGYEQDRRQQLSIFGAQETVTNTYSAELEKKLPTGTELSVGFSDTRTSSDSAFVSSNPSHQAEATAELRQPLAKNIFGYVDRRTISVTSLAIQNADLDTKERIEALFADVESAYWKWASAKGRLGIYRDILEKANELHKVNVKNYDTGLIERADFLASQANVINREKDVLLAENRHRQAEENIKLLMNIESLERLYPQESLQYEKMDTDLDECLRIAFAKRRDYQKTKREVEINNIELETKANERWPEIDLVATMVVNGIDRHLSDAADRIRKEDNTYYSAGVEISIPLENNSAKAEFKKATYEKEKAILTLKQTERTIVTNVGNVFRNYMTYQINVSNLNEVASLQSEKLKEEDKRFKYGRSNTKRLIDYQQDYLLAQLALGTGLLDLELARVNLQKALNTILEKYEGML